MTDTTIRKSIFLAAPPETVWGFLTQSAQLGRWFHPSDQDMAEGQPYTLRDARDGDRMCWGDVQEMRPHAYMRWSFTVGALKGAMTVVEWHLAPAPGGTRVTLTHSGLPESTGSFGLVLALDKGWHGFLGQLIERVAA